MKVRTHLVPLRVDHCHGEGCARDVKLIVLHASCMDRLMRFEPIV